MDKEHALLLTHHIKPDYGFYVQSDDRLACVVHSSVASLQVRFSGYFLSANGEVREYAIDVFPTSDRAATSVIQTVGEGFILSCRPSLVSGNANRGQCYVRVGVQRNTGTPVLPLARLVSGYLTDDFSPAFPFGHHEGPLDGPGNLRSITGTNPAAGAEISETVPTGARWALRGISAFLVTDVTAVTRLPHLVIDDGTTLLLRLYSSSGASLSSTVRFHWAGVGANLVTSSGNFVLSMLPPDLMLSAGWRISMVTVNLQAADDWSAPQLYIEEWIEA